MDSRSIILFDGICNLCNGWVNFVIDRDPARRFVFAPLQSNESADLLAEFGESDRFDSIVLIDGGEVRQKSDAVLAIVEKLHSGWRHLRHLRVVPRSVRDLVYDLVARNRYSWFGRRDACRLPTPELTSRFLQFGDVSSTDT